MLNCVYHPVDSMRVVSDEDRKELLATGVWFDTPQEAKSLKTKILNDKAKKSKPKKEKVNEKSSIR